MVSSRDTDIRVFVHVCVSRTGEAMLVKFSSLWTLASLSAFVVVSQCLAAPTQREKDGNSAAAAAADAAAADPPLVRSMYIHTRIQFKSITNLYSAVYTSRTNQRFFVAMTRHYRQ